MRAYCFGPLAMQRVLFGHGLLADRTVGRAFGTVCSLSVVCDVLYCGKTVRLS